MKTGRFRWWVKAGRLLVVAALGATGVAVYASPAAATIGDNQIPFEATVSGDHLCLSDGASAGTSPGPSNQAGVWHCAAANADLEWTFIVNNNDAGFKIFSSNSHGCLADWGLHETDGAAVGMYGNGIGPSYGCGASAVSTRTGIQASINWVVWSDQCNGLLLLMPEFSPRGLEPYGSQPVLSIAGPAQNGSKVQMWRSGANNSLQGIYQILAGLPTVRGC